MLKPMKMKSFVIIFLLASVQLISFYGCTTEEGRSAGSNDFTSNKDPNDDGFVIPDWVKTARVASLDINKEISDSELDQMIDQRSLENVSVALLDSRLSVYLNDTKFNNELRILTEVSRKIHQKNMKAIAYYPSLEVFSENAATLPNSAFKDHPDWVEKGLDGIDNVVLGGNDETAWMSPNGPYRQYFLDRIRKLASTALDGVWIDAAVYKDSDAGGSAHAAKEFMATYGLGLPTVADVEDATYRTWVKWRHENLARFLDDIKNAANAIDPNFMIVVETPTVDNLEATATGLDGAYRVSGDNFIRVYKIDSVSNTKGMEDAHPEDFTSMIAMNKWAIESERGNPSWSYSFGSQTVDAGLVMSALLANGISPFEAQTPARTKSVSSDFRKDWFGFIKNNSDLIFNPKRVSLVGIWYDSNSRDFGDHMEDSGDSGKYVSTLSPVGDPDWWTNDAKSSAVHKPHLGGWRGMAHNLVEMGVSFKPIIAQLGVKLEDIVHLKLIILPSVTSVSAQEAQVLKDYVSQGGFLIATNEIPGQLDELGNANVVNPLEELFKFKVDEFEDRLEVFGKGVALYRPNFVAANFYRSAVADKKLHYGQVSELERFIRVHIPKTIELNRYEHLYVEQAVLDENTSVAYFVNYAGLKQPIQKNVREVTFTYYPPPNKALNTITAFSPTLDGDQGKIVFQNVGQGIYQATVKIDQLSILKFDFVDAPVIPKNTIVTYVWPPGWEEAAKTGLDFILTMRNPARAIPFRYGVFTNLKDVITSDPIYAYGHHITAEHMGLLLRTSACLNRKQAFEEGFSFVSETMVSPIFNTVQWAIDKEKNRAYLELDDDDNVWGNANAPLDDFRALRGILDGHRIFGDQKFLDVALKAFNGTYWTTVIDTDYKEVLDYPKYKGGIMAYAFDSVEVNTDPILKLGVPVPANATGLSKITKDLIPVDYQDLYTIGLAAEYDIKWKGVVNAGTQLLLDSEIPGSPGLYYNGLQIDGVFTGDFENRDNNSGKHLKTIQELWTALHLVRIGLLDDAIISPELKALGKASSARSYKFFKDFYNLHLPRFLVGADAAVGALLPGGRIPEYLTFKGKEVPDCTDITPPLAPADCLIADFDNLVNGEARIHAQLARLAFYHDDIPFGIKVINDKIMTDRVAAADPIHPRSFGMIGKSTANPDDSEAWNTLESLLSMCLIAKTES